MIQFYNTYSRSIEPFRPIDPAGKDVKMYTCGPTVYSYAHIGNLRTFLFEDLLQRHLEARGFDIALPPLRIGLHGAATFLPWYGIEDEDYGVIKVFARDLLEASVPAPLEWHS